MKATESAAVYNLAEEEPKRRSRIAATQEIPLIMYRDCSSGLLGTGVEGLCRKGLTTLARGADRRAFPVSISSTNPYRDGMDVDRASRRVHELSSDPDAGYFVQSLATGIGTYGLFGQECLRNRRLRPRGR